ncbi:MAG: hypothetical protein M1269_09015, partial [Chloroflexi bacterium]|nr:hypothetical protein [Chloroflexota bacterium]
MDNILISMINASKLQRGEMKKESEASGDEFDKIFKDQFGDKAKKDRQDSARKTISQEDSPKQKGPEDRADTQKKMQMKYEPENMTQFKKQNPLLATLLEANTRDT